MHLITMAHLGEAQGVIQLFDLKRKSQDLFESDSMTLLLTGEGPFEASTKTAFHLGQKKFAQVINLGIAGSLKDNIKLGEVYPVRSLYLVIEGKPQFKTFQSAPEGLDCLTSFERILSHEKSLPLRGLGTLVDREAWGVAQAAKSCGTPFLSFKIVSDFAGTLGACEIARDEAFEWSLKLAKYLQSIVQKNAHQEGKLFLPGLYFTFTTHHQFQNLLNKMSIKTEATLQEVLETLPLDKIKKEVSLPKERTKKLLQYMERTLDPIKDIVQNSLDHWQHPFKGHGIDLQLDPQWENRDVKVVFDVKNDQDLLAKIEILKSLSLKPYHDILEGQIDVE